MKIPFPVSHSQLEVYKSCPLMFHLKYRQKSRVTGGTPTIAMLAGQRVHVAVERHLKGDTPEKVALNLHTSDERKMYAHWLEVCYPTLKGKELTAEGKLTAVWQGFPLVGYLDVLYFNEDGKTAYIVDVKTGKSLYFLSKKLWFSLQPDIYGILVRDRFLEVEQVVWVQHNVAADGAEIQQREVVLSEERVSTLSYWLKQIETDCAVPNESWKCGGCQFEETCEGRLSFGQTANFEYNTVQEEEDVL